MKKPIAASLAALILALSLSACNGNNTTPDSTTSADGTTAADTAAATTTEADRVEIPTVDDNKLIASVKSDTIENADYFDIYWGDFNKEYQFYLVNYGLDETLESAQEDCEALREQIISYLTREKIMLRVAEKNGFGASSLTAEDLDTIEAGVQTTMNSWRSSFESEAKTALGDDATAEQLTEKENELIDNFLAQCGYTTDIFVTWQTNSYIIGKLQQYVYKDLTVTEEDIDNLVATAIETAKKDYETSPATYESTAADVAVYVPEGTRNIKHILFSLSDEVVTNLTTLRSEGKDAEADTAREEALAALKEKADNVLALVKNGEDFDTLIKTYSDDQDGANNYPLGYAIVPKSTALPEEFVNAAFALEKIGDCSELVATDYGYHILCYGSDKTISEEDMKEVRESMKETLLSQKQALASQVAVSDWLAAYPYEIDYETIRVTPAETEAAETEAAETTAAETTAEPTEETTAASE